MNELDEILIEIPLVAILALFFMELLTDLIKYLYAPNLIALELIPVYLMPFLLIIIAPLITLILGKILDSKTVVKVMIVCVWIIVMSRLLSPLSPDLNVRITFDTLGVLAFIIGLPIYLSHTKETDLKSVVISTGFAFSLLLSVLFKSLGSTVDILMHWWTQNIAWVLGIIALYLSLYLYRKGNFDFRNDLTEKNSSPFNTIIPVIGISGFFIFSYLGYGSPGVITRWVDGNYLVITLLIILPLSIFIENLLIDNEKILNLDMRYLWIGNILFLIFFGTSVFIVDKPSLHSIQVLSMYLALIFSYFILLDFFYLVRHLLNSKPSISSVSLSLVLSGFMLVLFALSSIFTITWDYVRPISTPFKDKTPHILTLSTIIAISPTAIVGRKIPQIKFFKLPKREARTVIFTLAIIFTGSIVGVIWNSPAPTHEEKTTLTVMAYNIQQGFTTDYNWNFDSVLDVIRRINPDIIGLSESDTNRISSGNEDIVRYLADKLNMYSYFGPKTLSGTFGIALLSKYPIIEAKTYYMPSTREQTCIIEAKIKIQNRVYNVYVTHFGEGSYDREMQAKFTRDLVDGKEKVILMGDFNADPSDYYYYYLVEYLNDTWFTVHPNGTDENGYPGYTNDWRNPSSMIDHIFHSPDMKPIECYVATWARAADHMPIVATFDLT